MKQWQCSVCGYIHKGEEPPEICPVCGADRSKFTLLEGKPEPDITERVDEASPGVAKQWQCTVCGYDMHNGSQPPDICPVCSADQSKFVQLEEADKTSQDPAENPNTAQSNSNRKTARLPQFDATTLSRLIKPDSTIAKYLTQFHGHPISVHIPNGVLPLAVFFVMVSVFLDSTSFAIAAKYNTIFVTLFMPVVIFTGLVDWTNRFKARMTKVFKVKMICATIVLVISLILTLWWLIQPEIYQSQSGGVLLFLLLYILDFGAAAVAGWYGGKLVFPKR